MSKYEFTEEMRNAIRESDEKRQKLFDVYWDDMYARIKTIGEAWVNESNHDCGHEPDISKRRCVIEQNSIGISLTVWTGTSHLINCDGDKSTIQAFGAFREHDITGRWLRLSLWFEFLRRPFCIEYGCDEIDFSLVTEERHCFDIDQLEQVYDRLEQIKSYLIDVRKAQDD